MTRAVRASCALYKMLLFTYPGDFRLRFGSEMVTTFCDLISGEWEHKGLPGLARVWRSALGEVFSAAVPLHLQSPIVVTTSLSPAFVVCLVHRGISRAMTHVCDGK